MPPELERDVLFHAILMALTRYVPLPFLDDALRQAAHERMVRRLGTAYQRELSKEEVKVLTEDRTGCCSGCLLSLFLWPFKKVLARLLVVWDINRTVDAASGYFVSGYLLQVAFSEGLYHGNAVRLRDAQDAAAARVSTSPVGRVFQSVLGGASQKLRQAGQELARRLRKQAPPAPEQEAEAAREVIEAVEEEEQKALAPVIERLREGLKAIPASYYDELKAAFREALREQSEEVSRDALF
ncbi:MAG: hypothetical protein AMXMBFR33_49010 [Candidatus Xenobia bacterium]